MPTYIPLDPFPQQFQDAITSVNMEGGSIEFFLAGTSTHVDVIVEIDQPMGQAVRKEPRDE